MIHFFRQNNTYFVCQSKGNLNKLDKEKLLWLFGNAVYVEATSVQAKFVGPRSAMITPWSTNAVEITQNMDINGIVRIEKFESELESNKFDPMISQRYSELSQSIFDVNVEPDGVKHIKDIQAYNLAEGLSLNVEEVEYLENLALRINRSLTDSEVFGFSQVNSEHCRHKIFNGTFIIDGVEQENSLFKMIKETSKVNPNTIVSAYKDNVAFVEGPKVEQFAPEYPDVPSNYVTKDYHSVISIKAETHNFPTTVEPFNGAATGSGGEIRDRLAGGRGSVPLAGTAVYMTSYSRLNDARPWENAMEERDWLYQTPMDILIKASNGASDFGNKFGQPLIAGSVLTFEHEEADMLLGYDKVIMLAGGIGYGKKDQAIKDHPAKGDKIVILGGDNYRIGMGGAAVSSADTGELGSGIELNAVQRSNPEMQKRAANTVRSLVECTDNPIVSIHDHGAGGHLNCLSELVEDTGGVIDIDALPIGDPTLSVKEIIGNESQERMGLVIKAKDVEKVRLVAERERSPMYVVGEVTDDHNFCFQSKSRNETPMNLKLSDMFGSSPKTIMDDKLSQFKYSKISYDNANLHEYLLKVLSLEAVACKDWLTNKVDRCVGGLVAKQQCTGPLQLPLNNCGVMAIDYINNQGIATSIGHAPIASLIDPNAGARVAIAEALTNIVWAPFENGLTSVSLSANWMWPCRNPGEDARLYNAVKAVSEMAIALGINIPTGKDSLSMAQKYKDKTVIAPGTVIISGAGHCSDVRKVVEPVLIKNDAPIYYIDLSKDDLKLGGTSFAQVLNKIGDSSADIKDVAYLGNAFNTIQSAVQNELIYAGHDVSSGGLITTLLEMCFSDVKLGADLDLSDINVIDDVTLFFNENTALVIQADPEIEQLFNSSGIAFTKLGKVTKGNSLKVKTKSGSHKLDIPTLRDVWFETSYLLDQKQCANNKAKERFDNYKNQPLKYIFPKDFDGKLPQILVKKKPQAAIIREKGSNSEREMANAMFRSGFEVRDVHMTDLINGRETLEDVRFLGAVGGFSNSDVLGSAKGWAGSFKYNEKANTAITNYFSREDTLSIGICNGCQLFLELELINPEHKIKPKMFHNDSYKHESGFTSVVIQKNNSVMMSKLEGCNLGVWISHGEGKFHMHLQEDVYNIVGKYGYEGYPANPNGSDFNTAMMASADGRHLVTMPHIERSFFPWNWANYPHNRKDEVSPWMLAFRNAFNWMG